MKHPVVRPHTQHGAASLVVVVVLLAAMAIAIAYTNRHLVMEQKTSANQTRSTIAAEAAEAGLEWTMAMLNKAENIGSSCATSAVAGDVRFKAKYLSVNSDTGAITPATASAGGVHAACVWTGSAWSCSCPAAGTAPTLSVTAEGSQPGFAIVLQSAGTSGTLRVTAYGCTSTITSNSCTGDGAATASVALGGASGLATPPAAPLTARGSVSIGNAALGVINGDPSSNGITINAGMSIDAEKARITTVPGTPPYASLVGNDPSLRNTTEAQMFATFFGMTKDTYKTLPSVKRITCPCTETTISNHYNNGVRQFWLDGNLAMNANLTLGSATDPVLIVADGNIEMRGDLRVFGVMYSTAITWDNTGGGSALLQGAAISEGNYTGNGTPDYYYDPRVLTKLRYDQSSFVRVPGSWRDF
jgi:Tfp pilus assembly protein PilX